MKKRMLVLCLVLVLCLGLAPTAGADGLYAEPLSPDDYTFENGILTIRDGVERIGAAAFSYDYDGTWDEECLPSFNLKEITNVIIPDSVTSIGDSAFRGCENLISVTLPDKITDIYCDAFEKTPWLEGLGELAIAGRVFLKYQGTAKMIEIPDGVVRISQYAFAGSDVTNVAIPDSVAIIEGSAFRWCSSLTSIVIPEGVTNIGYATFEGCTSLTSVTIPASVVDIRYPNFLEKSLYDEATNKWTLQPAEGLTIYGVSGSYAETYAKEHNIPFVAGEAPNQPTPVEDKLTLSKVAVNVPRRLTTSVTTTVSGYEGKNVYAISADTGVATVFVNEKTVFIKGVADGVTSVYVIMADTDTVTIDQAKADPSMQSIKVTVRGSGGIDGSGPLGGGGGATTTTTKPSGGGGGNTTTTPVETGKPASEKFTDVVKDSWYEAGVSYVTDKGLFNGVAEGVFAPNTNMTRAMLMTVLARLDGQDTNGGDTWYSKGMDWAVSKGISDGTMPDSNVTREQLVTMLCRYAKATAAAGDLTAFVDGDSVSGWAVEAMAWAVKQGIVTGKGGSRLDPQGTATRAEVATIIQRFVENK